MRDELAELLGCAIPASWDDEDVCAYLLLARGEQNVIEQRGRLTLVGDFAAAEVRSKLRSMAQAENGCQHAI